MESDVLYCESLFDRESLGSSWHSCISRGSAGRAETQQVDTARTVVGSFANGVAAEMSYLMENLVGLSKEQSIDVNARCLDMQDYARQVSGSRRCLLACMT